MENKQKNIRLPLVANVTCFEAVDKNNSSCKRQSCKQWINYAEGKNCVLLTAQKGPLTLREIGKIYGLTRMRICQIEKGVFQKIRSFIL